MKRLDLKAEVLENDPYICFCAKSKGENSHPVNRICGKIAKEQHQLVLLFFVNRSMKEWFIGPVMCIAWLKDELS